MAATVTVTVTQALPAVGVHPVATDLSMPITDLATEVEARGLRSLFLPEHTHRPVADEHLPKRYERTLDPYIASAFAAAVTTDLEVGTGASLAAHHDAIALAKAVATLDHVSGGRFVLGVGLGSAPSESANHGLADRDRGPALEETIRVLRSLWSEDIASFSGRFRELSPSYAWPKPRRVGGPPVLLGARAGTQTFRRIVAWADGWLPTGPDIGAADFAADLDLLRGLWAESERPGVPEICFFFPADSTDVMYRQVGVAAELGIQRVQLMIEDRGRDDVLPLLDMLATALARHVTWS